MIRSCSLSSIEKNKLLTENERLSFYLNQVSLPTAHLSDPQNLQNDSLYSELDDLFFRNFFSFVENDDDIMNQLKEAVFADSDQIKEVLAEFYTKNQLPMTPFRLKLLLENNHVRQYLYELARSEDQIKNHRIQTHYQSIHSRLRQINRSFHRRTRILFIPKSDSMIESIHSCSSHSTSSPHEKQVRFAEVNEVITEPMLTI